MVSLNCFETYLEYIKRKDSPRYYSLIDKIEDFVEECEFNANWDKVGQSYYKAKKILKHYYSQTN